MPKREQGSKQALNIAAMAGFLTEVDYKGLEPRTRSLLAGQVNNWLRANDEGENLLSHASTRILRTTIVQLGGGPVFTPDIEFRTVQSEQVPNDGAVTEATRIPAHYITPLKEAIRRDQSAGKSPPDKP